MSELEASIRVGAAKPMTTEEILELQDSINRAEAALINPKPICFNCISACVGYDCQRCGRKKDIRPLEGQVTHEMVIDACRAFYGSPRGSVAEEEAAMKRAIVAALRAKK